MLMIGLLPGSWMQNHKCDTTEGATIRDPFATNDVTLTHGFRAQFAPQRKKKNKAMIHGQVLFFSVVDILTDLKSALKLKCN